MMYCERCNAEFSETMTYCKWCGQTLVEHRASTTDVRKCSSCSTPLQDGWTFCNTCGAKVTPTAQESASPLCLRCGAVIAPGASACLRCGHRFTSERSAIEKVSETPNVQYCFTCGDAMEAGKLYCKTCGAPVYNDSTPIDSPLAPQTFITPPGPPPPQDSWPGNQESPAALPAETFKETLMIESPGALPSPASPRTEVYQSLKPEAALPEPGSTIDLTQKPTVSPPEVETRKEDSPLSPGQTRAYGGIKQLTEEAKPPSSAEDEDNRATMQILFASDLQVEPDTFERFATDQKTEPSIAPDAGLEPPSAAHDLVFDLVITPLEEPAEALDQTPANQVFADPKESALPLIQSGTMRLDMDALPFESTVKEDTGPLTANRPTTKLSGLEALNPAALEGKPWQPPTQSPKAKEASPAPPEPLAQLPQEPLEQMPPEPLKPLPQEPPEPLPQEPVTILSQPIYEKPPAKHAVNTWQDHQGAAPPWPSNQPGGVQPAAKKSGGNPLVLIAAAVVILAVAGAAVWWFVLRAPSAATTSNTNTSSPANTNTATTNTSTANTNTTVSVAAPEGMVAVAAGEYTIGRDDGDDIEKPRHTIPLKAFFIDKTEVTNAEYKRFVDATNHQAPPHWQNKTFPDGQANFPVVRVNWQDASDYAKWAGKRLPTEAEWEAAARGATGRKYPWGNEWNQAFANIGAGESGSLKEVGKYLEGQSPFGALDMIGNAWEWTADALALYPGNTGAPPDEASSNFRVIRGGAFNGNRTHDASYRGYIDANTNRKELDKTGFRCAKDAN